MELFHLLEPGQEFAKRFGILIVHITCEMKFDLELRERQNRKNLCRPTDNGKLGRFDVHLENVDPFVSVFFHNRLQSLPDNASFFDLVLISDKDLLEMDPMVGRGPCCWFFS